VTPHIKSGALRGLGVAAPKRNAAIPDVPTYAEMGYPGVTSQSWVGFFAPAKTSDAVVAKLNTEINAVMKEPDSLEKIAKAGFDPVVKDTAETDAYFKSEVVSWGKMVQAIGFSN
jgi:tripartite-type tricarboxylate transporter receptor subunit TctC